MRLLTALALLVTTPTVSPFVGISRHAVRCALRSSKSDAEAHMEDMPKIWDELKKSERDIVIQQESDGGDHTETAAVLAEKMLETALDFVQTQESIEEEHVLAAHKDYRKAVEEETVLNEFVDDDNLKDIPLDTYVEDRLHTAQDREKQALKEKCEAVEHLDELHHKEETVKAALEELKKLEADMKKLNP